MGNFIKEALLNTQPYETEHKKSKHLQTKWERSGLLEGLSDSHNRRNMARLLENQSIQLIKEASVTSPSGGTVGSGYKGDEEWSGVALPLVRRVFGNIVAQDLVSVQPMNLPSGLVFYLDFQYGNTRMGHTASQSLQGKTGKYNPSGSSAPFGEDGFYGAGRYGYTAATGSATGRTLSTGSIASMAAINFDNDVSASGLYKITGSTTSLGATDSDGLSVKAWGITLTVNDDIKEFPQFRTFSGGDGADGILTLIVSASQQPSGTMAVDYIKRTTEAIRGDFEDTSGNATVDTLRIPEINLQLKSRPIVAKTRKLKAIWTPELTQDLNAYHSVDAESELTTMLSDYISMEIDLEILDMLINDAQTVDYWSAKQGSDYDAGTSAFVNTTFYGTRFEWYQTLVQKIQKVSNEIHKLTLRGGANFVVCSPKISTVLESLPGYNSSPGADSTTQQYTAGVSKIGAVDGRYTIYKNPYMNENTILVGFRGANFLETGAVYAPYVPLIMTPLVYDPSDFTPRKGVMTRYAKKMIRPEYYAKIYVADLNLI